MSVIRYGMISLLALISVFHSSFSFSNSVHGASLTASEQLTDSSNIVTSGDGLYVDEYETGRYIYRGANPNNFIKFNDELWRIIAVEENGKLKIMRNETLANRVYDPRGEVGSYRNTDNNTYCQLMISPNSLNEYDGYVGCNAWAAVDGVFVNGWSYSGTVTEDSSINMYLNGTYYNSLSSTAQRLVTTHIFDFGPISATSTDMSAQLALEREYQWQGKIGIPLVTDFLRANSNEQTCGSYSGHNSNLTTCVTTNYLSPDTFNYWLINTYRTYTSVVVHGYNTTHGNAGRIAGWGTYGNTGPRPVVYLTSDLRIDSGTGTSSDPYIVRAMGESDITLSINSALALEVSVDELVLEPVVNGGTEKEDLVVSVSTNDVVGYKLMMSSISDDTDLNHLSISGYSIPSTTNLKTSNLDLGDNTWGYNTGQASSTTAFGKIPSLSTPDTLKTTSGLALQDETPVTFGVKANMDTVAGTYMNSVIFTVFANI